MINNYLNKEVIDLCKSKYTYKTSYDNESKEVDIEWLDVSTINSYVQQKL